MGLKGAFEVISLIAVVDHLLGLFLENVGLSVGWGRWLGLSCCLYLLSSSWLFYAAHQLSNVVMLIPVVHQRYFGLAWDLVWPSNLLHWGNWFGCHGIFLLSFLRRGILLRLALLGSRHACTVHSTSGAGRLEAWSARCTHLYFVHVVHVLVVQLSSAFTHLLIFNHDLFKL